MRTKRVTLAYPYTDEDGKDHKPDASLELPAAEANRLLNEGRARVPEVKKSAAADVEKKG